jgi:hypothetical protein
LPNSTGTVALTSQLPAGRTAGEALFGFVTYASTDSTAGQFYGGTTNSTHTTRLNYGGHFHATKFAVGGNTGGVLTIKQSENTNAGGIRLINSSDTTFWAIHIGTLTANSLEFKYNGGNNGGYLVSTSNVAQIDFTGQHRSLIGNNDNTTEFSKQDLVGLIVISDGTYTNLDGTINPKINESLPNVILSETAYDKRVFGVVSDKEDIEETGFRSYSVGNWVSTYETSSNDSDRLIINSLGEGAMWICNYSGSLDNGDYITTSPIKGLGMKQNDDLLHNYTVAKITQDCNFDISGSYIEFEWSGSLYRKQFVGVTYHCG